MKSVEQGAATTIYAATAAELADASGAYLSDCAIAAPSPEAGDAELGERVWTATERLAALAGHLLAPSIGELQSDEQ